MRIPRAATVGMLNNVGVLRMDQAHRIDRVTKVDYGGGQVPAE